MSIDFSVLIWTILSFLLLLVLLNFTLYKPLRSFMAKRQQEIDEGVAAGKQAQALLDAQKDRQDAELAQSSLAAAKAKQDQAAALVHVREEAEIEANRSAEARREAYLTRLDQEEAELTAALEADIDTWVALLARKLDLAGAEEEMG